MGDCAAPPAASVREVNWDEPALGVRGESGWRAERRLLQSWWRQAELRAEAGYHPGREDPVGNLLTVSDIWGTSLLEPRHVGLPVQGNLVDGTTGVMVETGGVHFTGTANPWIGRNFLLGIAQGKVPSTGVGRLDDTCTSTGDFTCGWRYASLPGG